MRYLYTLFAIFTFTQVLIADNQTNTTTPVIPDEISLPFTIGIQESSFNLPAGLHSGVSAVYNDKWILLAGRTNGLHGFDPTDNFPPSKQNTVAYVVDFKNSIVYSRDLNDAASGLTQQQIDELSVTSPQSIQNGKTLYMCGGYGIDTTTGTFGTKTTLTAIDIPKLIDWIVAGNGSAAKSIRQTSSTWLQVTGGYMTILDPHLRGLLIFGQNFTGQYTDSSNGNYTKQVRRFQIVDTGSELFVQARDSESPQPDYRRRDLNVLPIIKHGKPAYVALSGVFTDTAGIWTVPVFIDTNGKTKMPDPNLPTTFKQGMNNYVSATAQLYSKSSKDMYLVLLGGITYGFFECGEWQTDTEFPFTNEVTTVKISPKSQFSQYLMNAEYPVILSTGTNPGNQLLFGAGAYFFNADGLDTFENGVIELDEITKPTVIGYIVGGIMSTLPNTNTINDSTASPYIFPVILTPRE